MIERQKSAALVNEIVNHPSVHPWVAGPITGPLDLTESIEDGSYIALMGKYGGFLFWQVKPGIYDAHSAVVPEGRGAWAIRAAHKALRMMFDDEGAQEIMMVCPKGNIAVLTLVRMVKAKFRGTLENGWWRDGKAIPADVFSMTKLDYETCR